jgi:hypothetical protein
VNCNQELCIELWSVINIHCEIEPANLLQYDNRIYDFGAGCCPFESAVTPTTMTEVFQACTQSFNENAGIIS